MIKDGVNILGFLNNQFGVAELGRLIMRCIASAAIPYVVNILSTPLHHLTDEIIPNVSTTNRYKINIIVANHNEIGWIIQQKGSKYFTGKYNIGVWCWETEKFPNVPASQLKYFDEIWTISEFCKQSMMKSVGIPIKVITLPIILPTNVSRYGGIDPDKFVVLFSFDFRSRPERKNPLGAIEAFKKAFGNDSNVLLFIKSINLRSNGYYDKLISNAIAGCSNIKFLDSSLSRGDTFALIRACDVYLSLHRSEGLGLGMMEAMAMGKVVIGTGYSGNMDFMAGENSMLVKYSKIQIAAHISPYFEKGVSWAEPDISDAAEKLKIIYTDKNLREKIGSEAKKSIEEKYNLKICEEHFKMLLSEIKIPRIEVFDESFYLTTHPDVAAAVKKGQLKNGLMHYNLYGKKEGRIFRLSTE
ncbi:MAG: glycosyltransferase [Hyperionvirus sp.]|uniref:Glycosyltransferase n=1 Tax=Hyperionvirus sp. TaxID=2487770 RepID=A0A3G5A8E3_9VIRU|nr:MAG: glycosyltransferase [Hyperionvirus sp.]